MLGSILLLFVVVIGVLGGGLGIGWLFVTLAGIAIFLYLTRCRACGCPFTATEESESSFDSHLWVNWHYKTRICFWPKCRYQETVESWMSPSDKPRH